MAQDTKSAEQSLKQMQLELKMQKKEEKKRKRQEKTRKKLEKQKEKMKKRYAKEGRELPPELDGVEERPAVRTTGTKTGDQKIAQAEVVEFKHEEWNRRSVQSLDEIEKKIDRFSGKGVKGLEDRYREKYGEEIKIPELYQIETKLELDQTMDRLAEDEEEDGWPKKTAPEDKEAGEKRSFFGRSKKEADITVEGPEIEKELSWLDLTSAVFFLMKKYGPNSGAGKKIGLIIGDIISLIFIIPIPIRIITTIVYVMKRRKARKTASVS